MEIPHAVDALGGEVGSWIALVCKVLNLRPFVESTMYPQDIQLGHDTAQYIVVYLLYVLDVMPHEVAFGADWCVFGGSGRVTACLARSFG